MERNNVEKKGGAQAAKDMDKMTEFAKKSYKDEFEKQLKNSGKLNEKEMERVHRKSIDKVLTVLQKEFETELTLSLKAHLISTLESQFENSTRSKSIAVGIDLGTTYSCIGIYKNGNVNIIPNEIGDPTTPSYVAFDEDETELIGQPAKEQAFQNPQNTVFDAKRLIGRKFNDPVVQSDKQLWPFEVVEGKEGNVPMIKIRSKKYFPEQISAKLLKYLKHQAEAYLKREVDNAVITVPAYFNDGQRQATKDAGTIAGLKVLRIINEPTAAAIAYSYEQRSYPEQKTVLVFDLGGGTFDVSLLTSHKGHISIKAVGGDTHLGGEDFDNELVRYCIDEFYKLHGINLSHGQNSEDPHEKFSAGRRLRRIRNECEKCKRILSTSHKVVIELAAMHGTLDLNLTITRSLFESLNAKHFEKCISIVDQVLKDAKVDKASMDDIVLVGGSSRIPNIQERLAQFFEIKVANLKRSMHADEAVARGACIAAYLASFESLGQAIDKTVEKLPISFSDVTPLSLGVEIFKNDEMKFSVIISRNTIIPCNKTSTYGTIKLNQKEVSINIYEGENPLAAKNNLLGQFVLSNLPENCPKGERIEVTMEVNHEGILQVTACCPATKSENKIFIHDHKGRLSKNQIEDFKKTELFFTLHAL